jgi:hypothetical protein
MALAVEGVTGSSVAIADETMPPRGAARIEQSHTIYVCLYGNVRSAPEST